MLGEKLIEKAIELGIPLISKFVKDKDLASKMEQEWRLSMSSQAHEIDKMLIEADQNAEEQFQQTVRAELAQNDAYTKRTRPHLARKSAYAAAVYVAFCLGTQVANVPDIAVDWSILTVLASPILTYMGVRTFDKWKHSA